MKVIKFGGSSVGSPERIKSIITIARRYDTSNLVMVCSAFGGVTDQLIRVSHLALQGDGTYKDVLQAIETRHMDAVRTLIGISRQTAVLAQIKFGINELEDILHGVYLVRELTPRTQDYIMSFGERLSSMVITEAVREEGLEAEYVDARTVIKTDNRFGYARVNFAVTDRLIQEHYRNSKGIRVVTGFIASAETGETTTLGRSGSDYTAAIFAGALRSEDLEIWTDVDGMMTADPRLVKSAFTVPSMSYEEAMELSHFGAKVIFPATMKPAMQHGTPIWIKNTFNPDHPGTVIHGEQTDTRPVKGISSMKGISLVNLQGSGLMGVVGVSSRFFSALAREQVNVVLISQASSEHSICIAVEQAQASAAVSALQQEFRHEIREGLIDEIVAARDLAIIAVVGDGMKHQAGTSGRMFGALGANGVNVVAIAQGSSERNISAVIGQQDVSKALNALHEAFFLSDRKVVNVFLIGTGLIGGTLLRQMNEQRPKLALENQLEIRLVGAGNSRKMIFNPDGLPYTGLVDLLNDTGVPMDLDAFRKQVLELNLPNSICVDCTASPQVAELYGSLLAGSVSVVTPNKKANSGELSVYRQLRETARKNGARFLYETNVGAGLPVINTLNDLLLSGDRVVRIEAVLSGTLNFIFSSFSEGTHLSGIIAEAREKGYTEPDPRDDLSGMDVARKILILSRECGLPMELTDVSVENLVPEDCRGGAIPSFMNDIKRHDDAFEEKRKAAAAKGERLRYMAVLENGTASVGLTSVNESHPFYNLKGSDNIILLTTQRYLDRPMVIRGPGAGAEVTAAGVFADIIRIGNYIVN
ncbi:MAG: bifunctional aspartate kinase/homoserine dehydrogenase I [Bacteroidota bacterium]